MNADVGCGRVLAVGDDAWSAAGGRILCERCFYRLPAWRQGIALSGRLAVSVTCGEGASASGMMATP